MVGVGSGRCRQWFGLGLTLSGGMVGGNIYFECLNSYLLIPTCIMFVFVYVGICWWLCVNVCIHMCR